MRSNQSSITSRLVSLDVFRGITIALMVLVNSPGNETAFPLLAHSAWNGCTLADLVFPFFIFIVGVSLVLALSKHRQQGYSQKALVLTVLKRSLILFCLGLFINAVPFHMNFATLRVYGVLQRIAICYCAGAVLFLTTRIRTQAIIAAGLLVGYWLVMTLVPVPGYGVASLTPDSNLAAYIDRLVFSSAHLYEKIYDPEGILSTFPAIAGVLLGNLTGAWLQSRFSKPQKMLGLLLAGGLSLLLGWIWSLDFPINKNLWTSSFVLWTTGLGLLLLALCYGLIDIKGWRRWSKPFEIFGVNAIALYVGHIYLLRLQAMIHLPRQDGSAGHLRFFITEHLFGWTSLKMASLLYAVTYILFWLGVFSILYRKKIFIRVG
jgi:predicted acyltransferase